MRRSKKAFCSVTVLFFIGGVIVVALCHHHSWNELCDFGAQHIYCNYVKNPSASHFLNHKAPPPYCIISYPLGVFLNHREAIQDITFDLQSRLIFPAPFLSRSPPRAAIFIFS